MNHLRRIVLTAFLAGIISGCGEGQPNAPTPPSQTGPEFSQKTADMMKAANTGMDLKKARQASAASKK